MVLFGALVVHTDRRGVLPEPESSHRRGELISTATQHVNEKIRAREVRLIDETGKQLGIFTTREALSIARERNLDLVASQVKNRRASVSAVLFGSESVLCEDEPGEIERTIIEREGVDKDDFVVPLIPECSSTGSRRELVAEFHELRFQAVEDALSNYGVELHEIPLSPNRLFELVRAAGKG